MQGIKQQLQNTYSRNLTVFRDILAFLRDTQWTPWNLAPSRGGPYFQGVSQDTPRSILAPKGGGGKATAPFSFKYLSLGLPWDTPWTYGPPWDGARSQGVHWVSIRNASISRYMVRYQGYVFCNSSFISCIINERSKTPRHLEPKWSEMNMCIYIHMYIHIYTYVIYYT